MRFRKAMIESSFGNAADDEWILLSALIFDHGVTVVTPNEAEKAYGDEKSYRTGIGQNRARYADAFRQTAMRLIEEEKVQAIVLGCGATDLWRYQSARPYIDVMKVHIEALIGHLEGLTANYFWKCIWKGRKRMERIIVKRVERF